MLKWRPTINIAQDSQLKTYAKLQYKVILKCQKNLPVYITYKTYAKMTDHIGLNSQLKTYAKRQI